MSPVFGRKVKLLHRLFLATDRIPTRGLIPAVAAALSVGFFGSPSARGALIVSRDGSIVYDSVNNVSWLANSNFAATNRFGIPLCTGPGTQTCINASGSMRYGAAAAWVQAMNAANYAGHNNWQLPTTPAHDSGCGRTGPTGANFGFGCSASAFGSLWNTLGIEAPNTAVPIPANSVGPFSNVQPYLYWSQSSAPPPAGNLTFSFATGWQGANTLPNFLYVLPMIPGKLPGTPPTTGNGLQVNPGGQTVYDPMTNITWLANANLAASNSFGLPVCQNPTTPALCVASDGAMTYASAAQFIANMNSANGTGYLGQTNWQLPTIDSNCPGYNCAGNQNPMGNLFYAQLNFSQGMAVAAAPNIAVGPFHNLQPYLYWTCQAASIQSACQANGPAPNFEWSFSFGSGFEGTDLLANDLYVTAYFAGAPADLCAYSLSAGGQTFSAAGGSGTITITTTAGCPWTVGAPPAGVILTSPASGMGSGTVTFQVAPNSGGDVSGSFTIAGQTFTIEQEASSIPGAGFVGSLAQVVSEGTWAMTLEALNLGTSPARIRMNLTRDNGSPMQMPLNFPQLPPVSGPLLASTLDRTLAAGALLVMTTNPDSSPTSQGWGQLLGTGTVSGFGIFSNPALKWDAVVPLESRSATTYILAFDNTGGLATGLAIANLGSSAANVAVVIRDDTGAQIGTESIPLVAFGHTSFLLAGQYPITENKRGTVEFDTPPGGQISALGLRANGPALTTLPVLAEVDSSGGSIPHILFNGGFTNNITLVNTGSINASTTLSFFADDGAPLSVPLFLPQSGESPTGTTLTRNIAPGASLLIQTVGQDSLASTEGSVQLSTNGNVSGFGIFRWTQFEQEASVPLETRNATSYVLPFDDTNGDSTGLAIANLANQAANVTVKISDDTGALVQTTSLLLNAEGHTSFMLPSTYSSAANIRGTVEFVAPAGGRISVIGLRATSQGTLTTIPVLAK